MRSKLSIFFVTGILLILTTISAMGEDQTIEMVIVDYMPPSAMQNAEDGLHGYYVDAFYAICARAGFLKQKLPISHGLERKIQLVPGKILY